MLQCLAVSCSVLQYVQTHRHTFEMQYVYTVEIDQQIVTSYVPMKDSFIRGHDSFIRVAMTHLYVAMTHLYVAMTYLCVAMTRFYVAMTHS